MNIFYKFTWRSLKENKARTIVTILGIMLSVALFTATTTSFSSLFHFMKEVMADEYGSWHLYLDDLTESQLGEAKKEEQVEEYAVIHNIGYAKLEKSYESSRPFLYVGAYEGNLNSICHMVVHEGRMPENSSEIMLSQELEDRGGVHYQVGDTLNLDLGVRKNDNVTTREIWQYNSYTNDEDSSENETWEKTGTKQYKVVGKFSCGMFEGMSKPAFTGITKADADMQARSASVYATVKDSGKLGEEDFCDNFVKEHPVYENCVVQINRHYLRMTEDFGFEMKAMLVGLIVILFSIIVFGSVALIYNSFSISISERKKQYGLLSSIGATRRQLKKSMMFEAVVLSVIGIPLGILLGLAGIGTTFYLLRDVFNRFLVGGPTQSITLQFSASVFAVIAAVVLGFLTILLSAWIPARKAVKIPAIEAIRQNDEILIKPRKVRSSRLTQKLFGLEGTLAVKNFRRNKRRYRSTIFSLFVSIVLFISATSFCDYLSSSLGQLVDNYDSDLDYWLTDRKDLDEAYGLLHSVDEVKYCASYVTGNGDVRLDGGVITDEAQRLFAWEDEKQKGKMHMQCYFFFIQDEEYERYLDANHFDKSKYMDKKNPSAIAYNSCTNYDANAKKYVLFDVLTKDDITVDIVSVDGGRSRQTQIGSFCGEVPFGTKGIAGSSLTLFYPMSFIPEFEKYLEGGEDDIRMGANISFKTDNPDSCALRMKKILEANEMDMMIINNYQTQQSSIALMTVIRVFSNGFIILILLIALANVFNTIATGIILRRREFAMLRSIGMTQKGFHRMMNYECLLYGFKGILYGLPVAVLVTFGIYRAVEQSVMRSFYVPWYGVAIAIGSVFVVVFSTMLYAMHKINKDNVVDVLKEDTF